MGRSYMFSTNGGGRAGAFAKARPTFVQLGIIPTRPPNARKRTDCHSLVVHSPFAMNPVAILVVTKPNLANRTCNGNNILFIILNQSRIIFAYYVCN